MEDGLADLCGVTESMAQQREVERQIKIINRGPSAKMGGMADLNEDARLAAQLQAEEIVDVRYPKRSNK